MFITKIIERDMGHRLLDHKSKCSNLHGHRYKVEITLEGEIMNQAGDSSNGMVVDFSDIKNIAKQFIDEQLDHGYMYEKGDSIGDLCATLKLKCLPVDFPPTAENIVSYLFDKLNHLYKISLTPEITLHNIKLRETPTSFVQTTKD